MENSVQPDRKQRPVVESQLLSELRRWQTAAVSQQDDITFIVVDVV